MWNYKNLSCRTCEPRCKLWLAYITTQSNDLWANWKLVKTPTFNHNNNMNIISTKILSVLGFCFDYFDVATGFTCRHCSIYANWHLAWSDRNDSFANYLTSWRLVETRSIYMVLRNHAAPCAHEQFLVLQASLIPSVQFSRVLYSLLVLFASQAWPSQVAEPP
jgi:hypothetical protein